MMWELYVPLERGGVFNECQRNLEMSALCNLEMSGLGGECYPQVHSLLAAHAQARQGCGPCG